jgi:hypothetical protein
LENLGIPDALLSVDVLPAAETSEISPLEVRRLIGHILASRSRAPRFLAVRHQPLAKYVVFLIFERLNQTRYVQFKKSLPAFANLCRDRYPLPVLARESNWMVDPAVATVRGSSFRPLKRVSYATVDEMIPSLATLYDNGYPYPPGVDASAFPQNARCARYGLEPVAAEALAAEYGTRLRLTAKWSGWRAAIRSRGYRRRPPMGRL